MFMSILLRDKHVDTVSDNAQKKGVLCIYIPFAIFIVINARYKSGEKLIIFDV